MEQSTAGTAWILAAGTIHLRPPMAAAPAFIVYSPATGSSGVAYNLTTETDTPMTAVASEKSAYTYQSAGGFILGQSIGYQWTADADF
jgi:hypothetical protein